MKYKIKYQYKIWEKDRHEFWKPLYGTGAWRSEKETRYKLIELSKKDWGLAWTDKGWERTEYFLNQFLSLSDRYGFKFVVVYFPITIQLYADASDSYMFLPQQKLRKYCLDKKIPFIDMLTYFKKNNEEDIFVDYCHHTPLGQELIAQKIYEVIQKEGNLQ